MQDQQNQVYRNYIIKHRISESGRNWYTCTNPWIHGASQNIENIKTQIDRTYKTN